ncbi:hypothetical protein NST07_11770 [Paenibacillus sp. FSL L8-0340]|uniref:hypothetical protein n=1 Tax=Paenibacillus sp. FSL L8-0340 TaxID=2954685 RepID=UPI003159503C
MDRLCSGNPNDIYASGQEPLFATWRKVALGGWNNSGIMGWTPEPINASLEL